MSLLLTAAALAVAAALAAAAALPATAHSAAQARYAIDRWNTESGLPQNSVNAILQSRDGYLWLATSGGVARFDGTAFTTITTGDRSGLLSDRTHALAQDREGRIWIGTDKGLSRYDHGSITTFTTANGTRVDNVHAVAAHPDGSVWFGMGAGALARVDSAGVRVVVSEHGVFGKLVGKLLVDARGTIWVAAGTGTWRLDEPYQTPLLVRARLHRTGEPYDAIALGAEGGTWIVTDSGLTHVAPGRVRDFSLPPQQGLNADHVRAVASGGPGVLWLGAGAGEVWRFLADSGVLELVQPADHGITTRGVTTDLIVDREGSVWAGNRVSGLARLRPSLFQVFTTADGLAHDNSVAVFGDSQGRVWAGAKCDGVAVYDGGLFRKLPEAEAPRCTFSIAEDATGAIWLGGRGVARWRNGQVDHFDPRDGWPALNVRALFFDRKGTLWIGSNDGLASWDGTRLEQHPGRNPGARHLVRAILESRDGALWLGTQKSGLLRYANGDFEIFNTARGLPHDDVRAIYEDASGVLWVCTYGGGLARLERGRITSFTTADGLHDNLLSSIIEDGAGNLWLSSNRGVFRVGRRELEARASGAPQRLHAIAYGRADGMLSAETNGGFQPAVARIGARLWYPTLIGVAVIDPAAAVNSVPPAVTLDRIAVNGQPHEPSGGLAFGPGAVDVELSYSGLSLSAPNAVTFRHRLLGWDDDWIDAGARRSASYSRLAPGSYFFRVMAANRDGIWSAATTPLAFRVRPHYWQTWWFRALAVLAIAALPLVRDRRLRRRQSELTLIVSEKTRELRLQKDEIEQQAGALEKQNEILAENVRLKDDVERISRHDLRTPLTSIISLAQIVREAGGPASQHETSLRLIEQAGYRVLNMANLTLDLFKMEQGSYRLTPKAVDIRAVAERVLLDLEALKRTREVSCEIVSSGFAGDRALVRGDELLSHSMLSNLLKNAIEATPPRGRVTIEIVRGELVRIRIHNPGAIPAAIRERFFEKYASAGKQGGTGLGAYSARLMALTQGGTIAVESSEEMGTAVSVELMEATPETLAEAMTQRMESAGAPPPSEDWPGRSVLVVDDDESSRAILRHFLAHRRWTVDEAENGPLALRKLAETSYDVVFLDVELPMMDGFEVVGRMRALERERGAGARRTMVVGLSSHDDDATRERALRSGYDSYASKPVSRGSIVEMVMSAGPTLTLDAGVRDLVPAFLTQKRKEVGELRDALALNDCEGVRRASHRLRGSFSLYGFTEAAALCAEIEELARSDRLAKARERLSALGDHLGRLSIRYGGEETPEARPL